MRPVERGEVPQDPATGTAIEFKVYQDAAPHLKQRLGRYCSYCERSIPVQLAVEHVSPKSIDPERELDWSNFLLACANCNSRKSASSTQSLDAPWPDQHDTFGALTYSESGAVKPKLANDAQAQALLHLVGLDLEPGASSNTDHRCDDRLEAWDKARLARSVVEQVNQTAIRNLALNTLTGHGHWSIWMTVFAGDAEMRELLINAFPGTAAGRLAPVIEPDSSSPAQAQ